MTTDCNECNEALDAACVRPLAAIVAAISIGGVAARAEDPSGPGKDEPWPVERQFGRFGP